MMCKLKFTLSFRTATEMIVSTCTCQMTGSCSRRGLSGEAFCIIPETIIEYTFQACISLWKAL